LDESDRRKAAAVVSSSTGGDSPRRFVKVRIRMALIMPTWQAAVTSGQGRMACPCRVRRQRPPLMAFGGHAPAGAASAAEAHSGRRQASGRVQAGT